MIKKGALLLALAGATATSAYATTLEDAIAAAFAHAPAVAAADADRDAAAGRVTQAWGGALPSATVTGTYGTGRLNPKNFFGLGAADVTPRAAQVVVEQPLFTGGKIVSGIRQAKAGLAAAEAGREATRLTLAADVASAYGDVLTSERMVALYRGLLDQMQEIERQAGLRFKAGEAASTDVAQARARRAEAEAGLARAEGLQISASAHYRNLVGADPVDLAPLPESPPLPATLDEAMALALDHNPQLAQAEAAARAARASALAAKGQLLPTISAYAEASTVRDQFFPDYRADGHTIGLRGRWEIPGPRSIGQVGTANAEARAADARLRAMRMAVEEQLISSFQQVRTARLIETAADEQATAAQAALGSIRHEVRVGMKSQLDLLDAEREAIAAEAAAAQARTDRIVAAYRLRGVIGAK